MATSRQPGWREEGTKGHMLWTDAALQAAPFKTGDLGAPPWLLGRVQVFTVPAAFARVVLQNVSWGPAGTNMGIFPTAGLCGFSKAERPSSDGLPAASPTAAYGLRRVFGGGVLHPCSSICGF